MQPYNFFNMQHWNLRVKNNKNTFSVPSAFTLADPAEISSRRRLLGKTFILKALNGVDYGHGHFFRARLRSSIIEYVNKALQETSLHFNRGEICILYNMYLTLTRFQIRPLELSELSDFLYTSLGITNAVTLEGLYRGAVKLTYGADAKLSGRLNAHAFVKLLSVLLRGTLVERASLAFHVADVDGDNVLRTRVEFDQLLRKAFDPYIAASAPDIDPYEPFRDTMRYLMNKLTKAAEGKMSESDFVEECCQAPWLVEGLVPSVPNELANMALQGLLSRNPRLRPIEPPRGNQTRNSNITMSGSATWKVSKTVLTMTKAVSTLKSLKSASNNATTAPTISEKNPTPRQEGGSVKL